MLGRKRVAARNMLIYEAINHEVLSRNELAKKLQVDPSRITRDFQKVEELIKIN
ncbi:hypothetical protein [Desulforamulus ruminis]|uniref:Helix-turn-helix type 11 domain-containing protein n=1 Tax=Desulforamulus ruminis (strain ATCC 23193 / DSM 2154 / NCIMB 8452 / DL) TaxID=696281 RepID=F6DQU9_DESRL|nr:hypothetical protein [Desulforamulus ruminis]AEG58673.1 hypothetical protein Desru_0376 [Desulforamulus ruminis DSM 2154]